ncbi:MAG: LLM class flavin-dependent oxidoreductase [Pseudomonadota bacterium]
MSLPKRIAVTLPAGPKLEHSVALVKWAEEQGFDDGWYADAGAPDSLTQLAAIGHHTKTLRLGVAVTPVYTRTPAVLAATADVISQVVPGRFVMGLGSSSHTIVGGWHGIALEKPLTRVKETAQMVKSMLAGEKSDFTLDTLSSKGYRQPPCENPPPIYLAALRAKMLEMAAEVGDGVIINLWPQGALPRMLEHIKVGAERAGKSAEDVEVVNRAMVLVTDDKAAARDMFRASFGPYYATPVYNKFLAWAGYEEAAAAIREGWAAKDRDKTAAAMSDAMIDEIAVIGSAEEVRERINADVQTGVHTQIIAPMATSIENAMRTLSAFSRDQFSYH